ncbi:glyoxylate/hydroxypyruvate reductase A [Burkholderia pseudomultivorans]|uniref:D-isomer specific 2-hydroxyacid dehydrogenase, NAD binding domain protein n=1 Tax=Burkholderia cenocepacia TaxID=95486 RepID=A0AAN0RUD9_9BURK|nr:glyoxylate/hydroxypyruvate reductase A [Burkholderia pseudomultivorans]AIO34230.1 D-isomer specific 2-hydroxyacid dehydrogenase, NAD binding domain protein [Burkholderia cenocepacia]AOI93533.1 glyoxylate/hydroxypyruvate reductase A [Burkholderia pseudomultivorans]KVC21748.1 glyoxylate/hydroxypyruvate reductase A [Burkholderia pseudomultivorans]KVC39020.1 glyoxylate/hydroxypyruvate reductase A [Burkholderia pseudomultivorans]MBF5009578.1 glyoxylate/hydroxypyruvate reductase A [Burkholderia p
MKILFHSPHQEAAAWRDELARALPEAELRAWQPGDTAPADYALVWRAPREFFAPRDGLRAIFNLGAGVDALLALDHAHPGTLPRHVPLVRLEDSGMAQQMIEYVTHAVLRYLRRFDEYEALQRARRWQALEPHPRASFTVAVLGLGVLGAQVARALAALGLPVRGYSRSPKQLDGIETFAGEHAFDACIDGAKVLVNLLPSTPDTDGILCARTFARLAPGAYLVNVARGAHLVDADLLDALASGRIAAATLDVFHREPLPADHPFWAAPRITITPHSSAETLRAEAVEQIAGKIRAFERGEPVGGIVDYARGY